MLVGALALLLAVLPASAHALTDAEIRQAIVAADLVKWHKTLTCVCPEDKTSADRTCGATSAYSKAGGVKPLCYPADVTDAMIAAWRAAHPEPAPNPEPAPWRQHVTLAFPDSAALDFDSAEASDRGDYIGPFVRQRNLCQERAAWLVCFRPDADGKRAEVVIEYGTLFDFSASPPKPASGVVPAHSGPYTATISGSGFAAPVTRAVANQWWMSRWREQSAPRPIVRSAADLYAMRAIMPLDKSLGYGAPVPASPPDWRGAGITGWRGPMDTGGLLTGMTNTADRLDIGPETEWQAIWLVTGTPAYETAWRAHAEATGTMAFWVRDAATGAPVDLRAHPYLAFNDARNGPYRIPRPVPPAGAPNWFTLDIAHFPAAAFVPWLLTDDPYFLEGAQSIAQYGIMEANVTRLSEQLPTLAAVGQTRAFAWGMRGIFEQAAFAPENPPSWLLPRSYWRDGPVKDSRAFAEKYLKATASPATTVFGLMTNTSYYRVFMHDFLNVVLAWSQWQGSFPEWRAVLDYASRMRMAMLDYTGASGWDARFEPYDLLISNMRLGAAATPPANAGYGIAGSPNTPTSVRELWECFVLWAAAGNQKGWTDPATWEPDKLHPIAPNWLPLRRGTIAALSLAGVPEARERHDWLKTRMDRQYPIISSGSAFKWAMPSQ